MHSMVNTHISNDELCKSDCGLQILIDKQNDKLLMQKLLGTARMYGSLDGQLKAVIHKPKKSVPEWKLVGTVHPQLQPQPCTPAKKAKNRL